MTAVAVIDIGKTNKKICLFDADLRLVAERQQGFAPEDTDDGLRVEPVVAIWDWLQDGLAALHREHGFDAVSVTTHGATFALLDGDGGLAAPVLSYDAPFTPGEQAELDAAFYERCGSPEALQPETATCDMPMLVNAAKALLHLERRRPGVLARSERLVDYPQFWGYRLTGELAAEATYTANHSFLFDPHRRAPSSAARALGADRLLSCAFRRPWDRLGVLSGPVRRRTGLPELPVAVGIHDSNAALLPYLVCKPEEDFVLNSTGTWCVAMHRVDAISYRPEEIGGKVIFNLDAFGDLHKSSFLMAGQDFDLYRDCIAGEEPPFAAERVDANLRDTGRFVLPGASFPSHFPGVHGGARDGERSWSLAELQAGSSPDWFGEAAAAYDLLDVSLALQSEVAIRRCDLGEETALFVEGGFRRNPTYLSVLAALFGERPVFSTNLEQATGTGTALLGHAMLEGVDPRDLADRLAIEQQAIAVPELPALPAYRKAFLAAMTASL